MQALSWPKGIDRNVHAPMGNIIALIMCGLAVTRP